MIEPLSADEEQFRENLDVRTRDLVGALSFGGTNAEDAVRDWFELFPESLYRVAGAGLTHKAQRFVHALLAEDRECCRHLCDPKLLDAPAAVGLVRSLLFLEPRLDRRIAHAAIDLAATAKQKALRRCLDILDAITLRPEIESSLVQLLKSVDGSARARVVNILVRLSTSEAVIRKWLRDPDPRVRANVVESLVARGWEPERIRPLLLEYLNDPHWRVAANAAVGLCVCGGAEAALARLTEMAASKDANARCSSAWAMGRIPDAKLFELLHQLRKDPDARVRWNALRSLSRLKRASLKQSQALSDGTSVAETGSQPLPPPDQPDQAGQPAAST
jgi:hypothetical protein